MASAAWKQACMTCYKSGGVATCGGCQRWFCGKHFIEHRHELTAKMDDIGQEHDLLRRDLLQENNVQSLLSHIDDWEKKSIKNIQEAAEKARADVRELIEHSKQQLYPTLRQVAEQLQLRRESDDYTEIDLEHWVEKLKEIRKLLEEYSSIEISENVPTQSLVGRIQVKQPKTKQNENHLMEENFIETISSK
ncbi:unnamed protein product [Rotaria sp. Silwood2]|nr:unnamed protein product [Rotaria sp. Silwood2]CAF4099394.1 unnamed protein product [Rotaria sp. Silwood2]